MDTRDLERLKDDYNKVHGGVHEIEDRMDVYKPFYEEMSEFLQEYQLEKGIRKRIDKILSGLKELITIEEKNLQKDNEEKNSLLQKIESKEEDI